MRQSHGKTNTPEYRAWKNMKSRCYHNTPRKARYRGRGITVCPEWLHDFEQFYNDVGPRPSPEHSLDRRNNDGNYEPGNVHWATDEEQRRNTGATVKLTHNGKTQILFDWARELNINPNTLVCRILRYGWSTQEALTTPVGSKRVAVRSV